MKLNSPLPQPLPKECEKAAKIFKSFVSSGNNGLDGVIPREILERAKGFAIFTIVKAGFVFSARAGSGIVIARLNDGSWSAPSAIGTAGVGVGGQIGAEMTDFLVVLNSRSAINSFMAAGSLTLGGNMSIALGPLGRNGEASGSLSTNGKVASMYSYSKTRGLFGGLSVEGSVIVERQDANVQAYNSPVTARLLLGGTVDPPQWAMPLIKTLEACTGMPGNRGWINEDIPRTPGGTYAFGGVASPGSTSRSPSFLRKKKKPEPTTFPPTSWGTENTSSGSYFAESAPQTHNRNATWDGGNRKKPFESGMDSPSIIDAVDYDPFNAPHPGPDSSYIPNMPSSTGAFSDTSHRRAASLSYKPAQDRGYPSTQLTNSSNHSAMPFIKPREELTKPLSPHEGVARGIALFDFHAAEDGDLSFRKGDVIIITKKSDTSDDWWTGKVNGNQGIFPANFVDVI